MRIFLAIACGVLAVPDLAAEQERTPVLVFAAASLTNVLGELSQSGKSRRACR